MYSATMACTMQMNMYMIIPGWRSWLVGSRVWVVWCWWLRRVVWCWWLWWILDPIPLWRAWSRDGDSWPGGYVRTRGHIRSRGDLWTWGHIWTRGDLRTRGHIRTRGHRGWLHLLWERLGGSLRGVAGWSAALGVVVRVPVVFLILFTRLTGPVTTHTVSCAKIGGGWLTCGGGSGSAVSLSPPPLAGHYSVP